MVSEPVFYLYLAAPLIGFGMFFVIRITASWLGK